MRILFFVSALHILCASGAYAIKPASTAEIKAIQNQIYLANRMDKEVGGAQQRFDLTKDPLEKHYREMELTREKDKQRAARTIAIHMTLEAYDLDPADANGTSVVPWTKGRAVSWLPVAGEPEARQIQDGKGGVHNQAQPKERLAGKTYVDGVVYIYPETFTRGVGFLASTLLHERIHFEQMTTPGKGDVISIAESETEAFQAEKNSALIFFDPNNAADSIEMAQTPELLT